LTSRRVRTLEFLPNQTCTHSIIKYNKLTGRFGCEKRARGSPGTNLPQISSSGNRVHGVAHIQVSATNVIACLLPTLPSSGPVMHLRKTFIISRLRFCVCECLCRLTCIGRMRCTCWWWPALSRCILPPPRTPGTRICPARRRRPRTSCR
jgi:hypothetical protein